MLFNQNQISSSISLDKNTGLYEIKLPGIKRQFESIYYSFERANKGYGDLYDKFEGKNLQNKLVGISRFNNHYIICFINLNNLTSNYYFIKSFDLFSVDISNKNYNIFIYIDFKGNINYASNYKGKDFSLGIINNSFIVKNNIFDTEVFTKNINLDNILVNFGLSISNTDNNDYLDIADFFIYDDYFIESNYDNFDNLSDFLDLISNKNIILSNNFNYKLKITKYNDLYYPKIKINLSILSKNIKDFNLGDFRKILLSFFSENISCYLFDSKEIKNHFSNFHDFTNIDFNKLDLNFNLPDNIFNTDTKFNKFKLDLLKLRYNLYLLRESYKIRNINKIDGNNEFEKVVKNRLDINKINLETTITNYENMLGKLLKNIKNKI